MKQRLESLDVLRGFDMFFIFLADPAPCICAVALTALGFGDSALAAQFDHVHGAGFHFYDLIFPLFLFMAGVTWPFSLASQLKKGVPTRAIVLKILRRTALLVFFGSSIYTVIDGVQEVGWQHFDWAHFRVWSVLARIGLAWGAAALLTLFLSWRSRLAITAVIMAVMWYLLGWHADFLNSLDVSYLTTTHQHEGGSVLPNMIPTAMAGVFAGELLRSETLSMNAKALRLALIGAGAVLLGLVIAFALGPLSLPIHKGNWSTTFVLVAGGCSFLLLALFYWLVDVKGHRRWGFFFKVIGMNALTIYVLNRTVLNYAFEREFFFGGIVKRLSPAWGELVAQTGLIALGWLLLYYLYRKEIFLRV